MLILPDFRQAEHCDSHYDSEHTHHADNIKGVQRHVAVFLDVATRRDIQGALQQATKSGSCVPGAEVG